MHWLSQTLVALMEIFIFLYGYLLLLMAIAVVSK